MELITSLKELKKNLATLEDYMKSTNPANVAFYKDLIKKGICFVAYEKYGRYIFAPSRFIGYKNNDMHRHISNASKDGRVTTPVINKLLDYKCTPHDGFEIHYNKFCKKLGFKAKEKGTYGATRKFWVL